MEHDCREGVWVRPGDIKKENDVQNVNKENPSSNFFSLPTLYLFIYLLFIMENLNKTLIRVEKNTAAFEDRNIKR